MPQRVWEGSPSNPALEAAAQFQGFALMKAALIHVVSGTGPDNVIIPTVRGFVGCTQSLSGFKGDEALQLIGTIQGMQAVS